MDLPLPPKFKDDEPGERLPVIPPEVIDENERSFIYRKNLAPYHRDNPLVIAWLTAYLATRSVKEAARLAGISRRDGETLKSRADIAECIAQCTEKMTEKFGYNASEVIERVKNIASADMADFQNPDGSWIDDLSRIPYETRMAVKKFKVRNVYENDMNGIRQVSGRIIEVEFKDALKADELLAREKGVLKETKKVEHDVTGNMREILLEARHMGQAHMNQIRQVEAIGLPPMPALLPDIEVKK